MSMIISLCLKWPQCFSFVYGIWLIILKSFVVLSSGCKGDQRPEMMTADVGDIVTLSCPRNVTEHSTLFWMRLSSGQVPEFLGAVVTYDSKTVSTRGRFTAKQAPGTFILLINETTGSDGGLYLCFKVDFKILTFFKAIYLRIQGEHCVKRVHNHLLLSQKLIFFFYP